MQSRGLVRDIVQTRRAGALLHEKLSLLVCPLKPRGATDLDWLRVLDEQIQMLSVATTNRERAYLWRKCCPQIVKGGIAESASQHDALNHRCRTGDYHSSLLESPGFAADPGGMCLCINFQSLRTPHLLSKRIQCHYGTSCPTWWQRCSTALTLPIAAVRNITAAEPQLSSLRG